jgi:hypothetical protein
VAPTLLSGEAKREDSAGLQSPSARASSLNSLNLMTTENFPMTKLASHTSALVISLLLGSAAIGCGMQQGSDGLDGDTDQATQLLSTDGEEAVTSNEESTESLTDAAFEATGVADPAAAADALENAPEEPIEGRCRSRAKDPNDPNTVIITLNNCLRRFGKVSVSGKEIVHFTKNSDGSLHAEFESEGLTFNGKPATHTASADITVEGTVRHIVWQGSWERTNLKGEAVKHQSDLTIDVDTATRCRTRNGEASTTVGDRQIATQIQDLKICRDGSGERSCPTGTVIHTNTARGKEITVQFDGSSQAEVTTSLGRSFERPLLCQE